jgi:hypothetical protein
MVVILGSPYNRKLIIVPQVTLGSKDEFPLKTRKNVLSAIINMKESNASLMAKVWVRLARSSQQELE